MCVSLFFLLFASVYSIDRLMLTVVEHDLEVWHETHAHYAVLEEDVAGQARVQGHHILKGTAD
jgi:hypothetical protein